MTYTIVGGGIAGLSVAWHLARSQAGHRVQVLEAGELAGGASWAAAGMLAPVHELEFQELELLQAGLQALAYYPAFCQALGAPLDTTGTLEVPLDTEDLGYLQRLYRFQQAQGLAVTWLEQEALRTLEPELSPHIQAGILARTDIQVEHRLLLPTLIDALLHLGVELRPHTPVYSWASLGAGSTELQTNQGSLSTNRLILATGCGLPGAELQLPHKVYPIRGQMLALETGPQPLLRHSVRIRSKAYGPAYLVPKPNRLLIGSTSEEMGRDTRQRAGGLLDILRKTYRVLPALYHLHVQDSWAGLRPATLSRMPCLGAVAPGVWMLNGLYRHGILLGPYLAQQLVAVLQGAEVPAVLRPFWLNFSES